MTKTRIIAAVGLILFFLLLSCEDPNYTTIEWQADGNGYIQYSTNDPANKYTVQIYPVIGNPGYPVEVKIKKMSGYGGNMYGVVFGYIDDDNYHKVVITTSKTYVIKTYFEGDLVNTKDDTSNDLNSGFDVDNEIVITHANTSDDFYITFNIDDGGTTFIYTYDEHTDNAASGSGFYANVIEYNVDNRYQMTTPNLYPTP